jgi:hypothetical protein
VKQCLFVTAELSVQCQYRKGPEVSVLFWACHYLNTGITPNENFDWQQASGGMVAFAKYFEEIANLKD